MNGRVLPGHPKPLKVVFSLDGCEQLTSSLTLLSVYSPFKFLLSDLPSKKRLLLVNIFPSVCHVTLVCSRLFICKVIRLVPVHLCVTQ